MKIDKSIFRSYDIRGVYPQQINEEATEKIAQSILKTLSQQLNKPIKDLRIVTARDGRESSQPLMDVIYKKFLEYGVEIEDVELASINCFYFAVHKYKCDAGVIATASHNPPQYGGLKVVTFNKEKNQIAPISGKMILEEFDKLSFPIGDEKVSGKMTQSNVDDDHLKHIFSFIDIDKIKPLKVVVDTGNGMNGLLIPKIFKKLPCELVHIFKELDGQFPNRAPNPLEDGASDKAGNKILEEGAGLGVMFDSDGDRMFLLDERGQLIKGDMTLILLASSLLKVNPGAGIVYNLICSHAVSDFVSKWGGKPIRSEVGFINLSRHMMEEGGIASGEVSGHFAFRDNFYADNAFIALLLALETISEDGRPLSEIIKDYSLYARGDEINIKVEDIPAKLDKIRETYRDNIKDEIDGITVEFYSWWFNVRPSNTEPLLRVTVEANTPEELEQRQEEVLKIINS